MYILKLVVDFICNFISSDLYVDGYGEEKKVEGKKWL